MDDPEALAFVEHPILNKVNRRQYCREVCDDHLKIYLITEKDSCGYEQ